MVEHKAMVLEDSEFVKENEVDKLPNRVELWPWMSCAIGAALGIPIHQQPLPAASVASV